MTDVRTDHPLLCAARNPLHTDAERLTSWRAWEALRERAIMGELGALWFEAVDSGRLRLCDVPHQHRDFVLTRIKAQLPETPSPPQRSAVVKFFGGS